MSGSSLAHPFDCTIDIDTSHLAGKTAIVTGGASGLGEAYVRALVKAGLTVCIGDLDIKAGEKLAAELQQCHFFPCDVTNWEDQVSLFSNAVICSPTEKIDFVIANAGIIGPDDVFTFDGSDQPPKKPDLSIIDVNITATLYTTKLAFHHFILQNGTHPSSSSHRQQTDTCLILIGSGAAFLDCPRAPQYAASKWAARGIMHSLRRTAFYYGSRVNVISPWYVRTNILPDEVFDGVERAGVQFAKKEDAGGCLVRVLADRGVNGRMVFVGPRKWADRGFVDLGVDEEFEEGLLGEIQREQVWFQPVEGGLFSDKVVSDRVDA
ncbi:putative short chain dehydrogenase/ reductase [Plenodomus tracheiphilus IPT5]|uniref:Short chain dehydrogenase/ reductase n=1 Tax=Plenodomus tracheiphilus IPT5 TaxID=1408161 RepID=A0A6A7B0J7_9PLEO|nr:putative short chain dehydrogenase/ reductase [Plenodomus tracheiphilus IPT5]